MMGFAKTAAAFVVEETTLSLLGRVRRRADALIMTEAEGAFHLFERKRGTTRPLADGTIAEIGSKCDGLLRRRPVELRIDPGRVIDRTIRIPAASRPYADAVVRHQLDRITPFAPNKVVFDFEERGIHGHGAAAEIELRVVAIARTAVEAIRNACAQAGIRLSGIGLAAGAVEAPSGIDLASHARASETARLRARVRAALSGLLVLGVVATAAGFLVVDVAARKGEALSRTLDAARKEAIDRRRDAEGPTNPVLAMKRREGNVAAALLVNELARILPEGTYLTTLAVEEGKVRLTGLSTKASALVGLIEGSSLFDGATFTAPVLSGQTGGLERFEVLASFGGPVS